MGFKYMGYRIIIHGFRGRSCLFISFSQRGIFIFARFTFIMCLVDTLDLKVKIIQVISQKGFRELWVLIV